MGIIFGKPVTNRCVYIDHIDAIKRFTITGGYAVHLDHNRRMSSDDRRGGGVFIEAAGTLAECSGACTPARNGMKRGARFALFHYY